MSTNSLISTFYGKNPGPLPFLSLQDALSLGKTCRAAYDTVTSQKQFWREVATTRGIVVSENDNPLKRIRHVYFIEQPLRAAYERGVARGPVIYDGALESTVLVAMPACIMLGKTFIGLLPLNPVTSGSAKHLALLSANIGLVGLVTNSAYINVHRFFNLRAPLILDTICVLQGVYYYSEGDLLVGTSFFFPSALHATNVILSPRRVQALCARTCGRLSQAATLTSIYAEKTWRLPCTQRVRRASSRLFAALNTSFTNLSAWLVGLPPCL